MRRYVDMEDTMGQFSESDEKERPESIGSAVTARQDQTRQ